MLYKILKDNTFFFIPYLFILLSLILVFAFSSKGETHLFINHYHSSFFDYFFKYLTFLGDGLFVIIPVCILLFFSLRHAVFLLAAYLSSGLFTQVLKRAFFSDVTRPSRFFDDQVSLHLVDGVKMLSRRSFPSGHATSAFALFLCLALIIKNRYVKLACLLIASLVAFSRVYLSQHFLTDIYVGSLIGSISAVAFFLVFYRNNRNWHAWTFQKLYHHERYT